MSQRFFPRNEQSRRDAILGSYHHGPLSDQTRRDGLAVGKGNSQATVAVTGTAQTAVESNIVAGGKTVIFTLSGSDKFRADIPSVDAIASLCIGGLGAAGGIRAALAKTDFALSGANTVLTVTLPAVATYSIAAAQSYGWTLNKELFANRAESLVVSSAINVANDV